MKTAAFFIDINRKTCKISDFFLYSILRDQRFSAIFFILIVCVYGADDLQFDLSSVQCG